MLEELMYIFEKKKMSRDTLKLIPANAVELNRCLPLC